MHLTDESYKKFPRSQHRPSLIVPPRLALPAILLSDETCSRLTGATTRHLPTNLPRVCCHQIHWMWIWRTRTSAMPSEQQPKILSYPVVEMTTYRVGMLSARTSTGNFCSRLKEATLTGLPQLCSSGSTRNAEIDGPRQFRLLTFRTLAEKHGVC